MALDPWRYDKEQTAIRRWTVRQYRRKAKAAVRRGDEALPRFRGTQGWVTW